MVLSCDHLCLHVVCEAMGGCEGDYENLHHAWRDLTAIVVVFYYELSCCHSYWSRVHQFDFRVAPHARMSPLRHEVLLEVLLLASARSRLWKLSSGVWKLSVPAGVLPCSRATSGVWFVGTAPASVGWPARHFSRVSIVCCVRAEMARRVRSHCCQAALLPEPPAGSLCCCQD